MGLKKLVLKMLNRHKQNEAIKRIYKHIKTKNYEQICTEIIANKNKSKSEQPKLTQEQRKIIYNLFCRYDYPTGTYKSGQKNHDVYLIDVLHPEASYIIVHNIYTALEQMAIKYWIDLKIRQGADSINNEERLAVDRMVYVFQKLFQLGYICQYFENDTLTKEDCELIKICFEVNSCDQIINYENIKRMEELKQKYKNGEILSYGELNTINR